MKIWLVWPYLAVVVSKTQKTAALQSNSWNMKVGTIAVCVQFFLCHEVLYVRLHVHSNENVQKLQTSPPVFIQNVACVIMLSVCRWFKVAEGILGFRPIEP